MEGLVKIGPWGGCGGQERDIVATGVTPHRLESVVIRCGAAVDAISFTYAGIDGTSCKAGPWGGSGGQKHRATFVENEVVKEISGTYGHFDGGHGCIVRSLTLVTNVGKHGPFGEPWQGTPFSLQLQNGARVVGFFGRSGPLLRSESLLDALGVYVHP